MQFNGYNLRRLINTEGHFYHFSPSVRLLTTDELCRRANCLSFTRAIEQKVHACYAANLKIPKDVVWHLEYNETTKDYVLHYASHLASRYVHIDFKDGTPRGELQETLIEASLLIFALSDAEADESENYLRFIKSFPLTSLESPDAQKEANFLSSLSFGAAERVFNDRETVFPFTEQECQTLLSIYGHLKSERR